MNSTWMLLIEFDGVGEIKVPKDVIEAVEDSDSGLSALYEDDSDSKEEKNDKDSDDKEKGRQKSRQNRAESWERHGTAIPYRSMTKC